MGAVSTNAATTDVDIYRDKIALMQLYNYISIHTSILIAPCQSEKKV